MIWAVSGSSILKCTAERADGLYARQPEFLHDVWPELRKGASEIEDVLVLSNHLQKSEAAALLGDLNRPLAPWIAIGPLANLSDHQVDILRSFGTDGYLNVLYCVSGYSELLQILVHLWPRRAMVDWNQLLLNRDEREALADCIATKDGSTFLGFGETGDPMFCFGLLAEGIVNSTE